MRFADDVALFDDKTKQIEKHLNSQNSDSLKAGLEIQKEKTKCMTKLADSEDKLIDQEKSDRFQIPRTSRTPQRHYKRGISCQEQSSVELFWKK